MSDVAKPYLTIRPSSGWAALNLAEVWQFRDLLFTLAGRDLKLRYKQTYLGAAWVILQPLLGAGVFSIFFGKILQVQTDGNIPYFFVSYCALLAWNLFNNVLGKSSGCLVGNGHLISKVYFPRMILPLTAIPATLLDFAVALAVIFVPMFSYKIMPGPGILLLPVWMTIIILMALGIGLITSALMVSYRDVGYVMPLFTQLLFYACPVIFPASTVINAKGIATWMKTVYFLNPLASVIEATKWSILGRGDVRPLYLVYAGVMSVVLFVIGMFAFKRMERKFADVV